MKYAAKILCVVLGVHSFAAAQERAFIQTTAAKDSYFVHEEITIHLRFGIESNFLADKLIQPFRRRLDLPVQIEAPWFSTVADTLKIGTSFVLNGERHIAAKLTDNQLYASADIETTLRVEKPGTLLLSAAVMRYVYADSFSTNMLGGRMPQGRNDAVLGSNELNLEIKPLPDAGRPAKFSGAVGEFTLHATVAPGPITAGESFKLVLHLEGRGNFDAFELPKLDRYEDFHLYGQIEERTATGRQVTYDLAALDATVNALPAIAFVYFDPNEPASYQRVQTAPIPLEVTAAAAQPVRDIAISTDHEVRRENDIFDIKPVPIEVTLVQVGSITPILMLCALCAPWLCAAGYWSLRRMRERIRTRPAIEPLRAHAATFKLQIATNKIDPGDGLVAYLAAHLGCAAAAIIAPDLDARLINAGIDHELGVKCIAALNEFADARFGGHAARQDAASICALIDLCEKQFLNQESEA